MYCKNCRRFFVIASAFSLLYKLVNISQEYLTLIFIIIAGSRQE
ncbi:hypothetical protein OSCI_3020035 [Kamptonema sp. PCC 6506]|nr:hypothetical protein OSCI_3020035 [Kamptonema sp. PCC 6506]